MGAMLSVVLCGLMCSIIKCFLCLGAYLTENPQDNHDNYVRYSSTDFVLESTLQRTEQQLLPQQQGLLSSKELCNQTHFSHYLRSKKRTSNVATTSFYLFVSRSATLCHRPIHLSIFFLWNLVWDYFYTDVSSKMS